MSNTRNKIEKFFSHPIVRIFGILIPLAALIIAIYVGFFRDDKVDVDFIITSNNNVLDINENVHKLDIIYDGTSLKKSRQNLRIINIKVINKGKKDVLKEFIDEDDLLGISVKQGFIVEKPELIESSSNYFDEHIKVAKYNENEVRFSRVIIESNEYFVFKILVLHDKNFEPELFATGKIAGLKKIDLLESHEEDQQESFFSDVFSGSVWVQIVRVLSYLFGLIIVIALIVFISEKIDENKELNLKAKIIVEFNRKTGLNKNPAFNKIKSIYYTEGIEPFSNVNNSLSDDFIKSLIENHGNEIMKRIDHKQHFYPTSREFDIVDYYENVFQTLVKFEVIYRDKEVLKIDQKKREILVKFIDFLIEKGEMIDYSSFIRTVNKTS